MRLLVTESLLLAVLGGGVGALFTQWGTGFLTRFLAQTNAPVAISPDGRVLWFTIGVSLLTGVLFGLAPALAVSTGEQTSKVNKTATITLQFLRCIGSFRSVASIPKDAAVPGICGSSPDGYSPRTDPLPLPMGAKPNTLRFSIIFIGSALCCFCFVGSGNAAEILIIGCIATRLFLPMRAFVTSFLWL